MIINYQKYIFLRKKKDLKLKEAFREKKWMSLKTLFEEIVERWIVQTMTLK